MAIRYLINEDGKPFTDGDINALAKELDSLAPADRIKFRNENAAAIAQHPVEQMLIVAGPGTGKSAIFKQRVLSWLKRTPQAGILALSFVRKLVADLSNDIQNDNILTDEQKRQVDIFTLHKYIRKFIEEHEAEIEQRREDLSAGSSKDPYLLILSPTREVNFYKPNGAREELIELIRPYVEEHAKFSEDYYKLLSYYSLANYPANNFTFRKVLHYEGIGTQELRTLLETCTAKQKSLSSIDADCVKNAIAKSMTIRDIVDSERPIDAKVEVLAQHIQISDPEMLRKDLERDGIDKKQVDAIEHQEEEDAELEELEVKPMSAVELMTIVSSKGLSADHVIIIGFDNVNMAKLTRNSFFVAITRPRKSLHLITALKGGGARAPHDFLQQMPNPNLEFFRYTKRRRIREKFGGRGQFLKYLQNLRAQSAPSA
jgi:superfamily I DNA/RNA helicase